MRKYLAFYENEWPANIAELTAVENKPFVGYLKGEGVQFTVVPKPVTGPADNEIWYTSRYGYTVSYQDFPGFGDNYIFGASVVSNEYNDGKGIITFDGPVTRIGMRVFEYCTDLASITIPNSVIEIDIDSFSGCSSLTSITFAGTMEEWNNVSKASNWKVSVPATYVQCSDGQVAL